MDDPDREAESLLDAYLGKAFALPPDVAALGDDDYPVGTADETWAPGVGRGPTPGGEPPMRPINLNLLTSAEAAAYWPQLDAWVDWLRRDYGLGVTTIPPMWHRHAELRWELSALHTAWLAAYDPESHAGAPIAWHRELYEAQHRLRSWVGASGTSLVEDRPTPVTPWPGEPGFGAAAWDGAIEPMPVLDRRADFEAWLVDDLTNRRAVEIRAAIDSQALLGTRTLRPDPQEE